MDAWADSLGAALTHRPAPARLDAKPKPEGDVLEITVTVTDQATPRDRLIVPFARWQGSQQATDWVEFDIAFARDSLPRGCFYSPVQGNASKPYKVFFKRGDGADQFGRRRNESRVVHADRQPGQAAGLADDTASWVSRASGARLSPSVRQPSTIEPAITSGWFS